MALLAVPNLRALDANADPASGGLAYVYAAGTTTPATTYSDAAFTTAQASPVVADANGAFASIFVLPGSYKLRIETSAGVLIAETDNIDLDGAGLSFANFAALDAYTLTIPAGQVVWTREEQFVYKGAAADATDQHLTTTGGNKLYCANVFELTPAMMGLRTYAQSIADGTEAVDAAANLTALQRLIAYSIANGINFRFDNRYICAPGLNFDWDGEAYLRANWQLSGIGGGGLIFYDTTSFDYGMQISGGDGDQVISASSIFIRDLLISQGLGSAGRRAQAGDGLRLTSMFHVEMSGCVVENFDGYGIWCQGLWDCRFHDNFIQHCGNEAGKKASVAFHDYAGSGGDQNTNSVDFTGYQIEHSYWTDLEVGGDLVIAGNGGGAQNFKISGKTHRKTTGETLIIDGLVAGGSQTGTSLDIDGLTGEPVVGDRIWIDGVAGSYAVTAVSYNSGAATATLTLGTSMATSPADNAAVEFISRYKANIRIFGAESNANAIIAPQIAPQQRFGILLDSGVSYTQIIGARFGAANPGRQPIYLRGDVGPGTQILGATFEDRPSLAADYIRDDSSNSIEINAIVMSSGNGVDRICNKIGGTGITGQYAGITTLFTEQDVPVRVRDQRPAASGQEVAFSSIRNSSNTQISRIYHEYTGGTSDSQILFTGLQGGSEVTFGYFDGGADLFRINHPILNIDGAARIVVGSGDPGGSVSAPVGSLYLRTDGGAGTTLYVKEAGTGNTGWAAV